MRTKPPRKPPPPTPKVLALNFLISVAIETFFPQLDWTKRYGRRGWAIHIALHAGLLMGMEKLSRYVAASARERAEVEKRLREELGRPPWPEELERAWAEAHPNYPLHPDYLR
jgi:hypothetical protein